MKFKVGDKVRIIQEYDKSKEGRTAGVKCEGYTGVVIAIRADKESIYPIRVKMDKSKGTWILREIELERL